MKVVVDSRAWIPKDELTADQLVQLRNILTITPKKVGDHPGPVPKPYTLYQETPTHIGVPRQYFMERRKPRHIVDLQVTDGDKARWRGPVEYSSQYPLRDPQRDALEAIKAKFERGTLGGILRAKPGWGKCQSISTTYVTTYPTGKRVLLQDLIGTTPLVASLKPNGSIAPVESSKIWHEGTKECLRLTLASGARIDASYDHPILTNEGWKKMEELQAGRETLVASARILPEPVAPRDVSDAEAAILGFYAADGSGLHFGHQEYVKGTPELVRIFEDHVVHVPGFSGFGDKRFDRGAWYVRPHGLLPWLREWEANKSSREKRIPPRVFEFSNEKLALFLRVYLTDGSLYLSPPYKFEISTSSEDMAFDLMEAFRRFGLRLAKTYAPKRAVKRGPLHDAWRLQLSDKDSLLRFMSAIGAPLGMEGRFEELRGILEGAKTNTNWDVVPVGKPELREIRQECKHVYYKDWQRLTQGGGMRWMSRSRFKRLVAETGYTGKYAALADQDVVWEGVRSIRGIGPQEVADLTVPETENVIANGVVVHNTVWSCAMIAEMNVPTLVIVHTEFLMDQWQKRIAQFLPDALVGRVQGKMCDYTGKNIVMGMMKSLAEKDYPPSLYKWPGMVITDEVHRIGAATWSPVAGMFPARYRIGISATPRRKDGADNVFSYHIGRVLYTSKETRMLPKVRRVWSNFRLVKTDNFNPNLAPTSLLVNFLCASKARNRLILEQLVLAVKAGRKILLLSHRLKHLNILEYQLRKLMADNEPTTGFFIGGMKSAERDEAEKQQVIFATFNFAKEGLDIPPLDTLFLVTPASDVEQAAGRILRPYEGKKDPVIVDFRDDKVSKFKRTASYRDKFYKRIGV